MSEVREKVLRKVLYKEVNSAKPDMYVVRTCNDVRRKTDSPGEHY
jgi:hypothetical protein